jgi:hypothetical protein
MFPTYKWVASAQLDGAWILEVDGEKVNCRVTRLEDSGQTHYFVTISGSHPVTTRAYSTIEEAQVHAENAWTDLLHTPKEHRYAGVFNLRISDLDRVKGLVKIKKLAELGGLSASAIAQKVTRKTQLTIDESEAMTRVLHEFGIVIERRPNR